VSRSDPPGSDPPPESKRGRRLESVIPDLIKKAVQGGVDRATGAQDSIRSYINDSKLPKEIVNALFAQLDDTKNGLFRVVAKEIRGFLEAVDFQRELQKLLTTVSFEIKTEIRFIPNDSQPERIGRPVVKSDMKVKRRGRNQRDETPAPPPARPEVRPPPPPDDDNEL
jgi:hypothetical protein